MQSLSLYPPLPPMLEKIQNQMLKLQTYFAELRQFKSWCEAELVAAAEILRMDDLPPGPESVKCPLWMLTALFRAKETRRN